MLTKRELFKKVKSSYHDKEAFRSAVYSTLRQEYANATETAINGAVKTFSAKINVFMKSFKNTDILADAKKHKKFFDTVIFEAPEPPPPPVPVFVATSVQTTASFVRNKAEKRKSNDPLIDDSKKRKVGESQQRKDAQDVRDTAVSSDAVHKASAQEFRNQGHHDACFIATEMAKNPSIATYLR